MRRSEAAIHDPVHLLGVEALRQCGRAGDVGEQHRDLLALTLERRPVGEDPLGDVARRRTRSLLACVRPVPDRLQELAAMAQETPRPFRS